MLLALLWGLGRLAWLAIARAEKPPEPLAVLLAEYSSLLAILQVWHLALPARTAVWVLVPFSLFGWLLGGKEALRSVVRLARTRPLLLLAALALLAWVAGRATWPPANADDALYYVQSVRWNRDYRHLIGLGLLHPYLVFNHGYHLVVAAVELGPFVDHGASVINSALLLPALWAGVAGLERLPRNSAASRPFDAFSGLLLAPVLDVTTHSFSSPSADIAVLCLGAWLALVLLRPALDASTPTTDGRVVLGVFAGVAACATKQAAIWSAAPLAAFVMIERLRASPGTRWKLLGWSAVAGAIVAVPWVVRGLLASGYVLFPSDAFNLRLPWRVDEVDARSLYDHAHRYARRSGLPWDASLGSLGWLPPWLGSEVLDNRRFLIPVSLSVLLSVWSVLRRRRLSHCSLWPVAVPWVGLALWFLVMPDTRFAGPLLWLPAAISFGLLSSTVTWTAADRIAWLGTALLAAGGAFIGSTAPAWRTELASPRHDLPGATFILKSGETVRIDSHKSCYDVPCAWKKVEGLRLRTPGDLGGGFAIERK
ncbi:MAG TPA: hypothetical protein DFS52_19720 [Myxococcales bacterium]|nr:hypothetical protein [Myxococcales bacterium]